MKRILVSVTLGVLLAGCTLVQPAPRDPAGATLAITPVVDASGPYSSIRFSQGSAPALDAVLTLEGSSLSVNAPEVCKVTGSSITCQLPAFPVGSTYYIPARGVTKVTARYSRANDPTRYKLVAQP